MRKVIEQIFDQLIQESEQNPDWKAVNALRCAKKELLNAFYPQHFTERPYPISHKDDVWCSGWRTPDCDLCTDKSMCAKLYQ